MDEADAPDPHLVIAPDGSYRAYGTQVGMLNVPVRRSADLANWSTSWDAMPTLPAWAGWGRTWAPGVIQSESGAWRLYFAALHAESGRQCIGLATAATPDGPFTPEDEPVVCQLDLGGSIDPYPYRDPSTGVVHLYWKSDENAIGLATSRLWGALLGVDGHVAGDHILLLARDQGWELPTVEQPAMISVGGRWWLTYSGNAWQSDRYATGFAACAGPLGPCAKATTVGPWLTSNGIAAGPGGLAFLTGVDGVLRAAWHSWAPERVGYPVGGRRAMHVEPVTADGFGLHLLPPAIAPFPTPETAVEHAYRDILVRPPDPAGLAFWASRIRNGIDDAAGTFTFLVESHEFAGVGEPIVRLYRGYFARLPDPAGLRYWMGVARQRGVAVVSAAFAASTEFVSTFGPLDDRSFVDRVYRNLLDRPPDDAGGAYWTYLLARGLSRGSLMLLFTESAEYRAATDADAQVVMLYAGMLDRTPDAAGLEFWSGVRRSGQPLFVLVAGILSSSEYRVRHRLP